MIIVLVVMLGFYGHDRSVIRSTANELAIKGNLWGSRYVTPDINEVDYERMKSKEHVDFQIIEKLGSELLDKRLLCGTVKSVEVLQGVLNEDIKVKINVEFRIWNYTFLLETQSDDKWIDSMELPRTYKETGDNK